MTRFVGIDEARTHLSVLVDQAAAGEEIVISKGGEPLARLVAMPRQDKPQDEPRKPVNAMKITYIAPDFDEPDPDLERP